MLARMFSVPQAQFIDKAIGFLAAEQVQERTVQAMQRTVLVVACGYPQDKSAVLAHRVQLTG